MATPRVLAIAGSDSGGGAGIQADIRAITALGGFATTAITVITAQNSLGVTDMLVLEPSLVLAQIDAVLADIGADAIKIGMIGSAAIAEAVADRLVKEDAKDLPIVFDPVLISTSGTLLADAATVAAFERLMARATIVTPNLPELAALSSEGALALARRIGTAVLAKGGHGEGEMLVDRLVLADGVMQEWRDLRITSHNTHGTGCTMASAIAVELARGSDLIASVEIARHYIRRAIASAPGLGAGNGPLGLGVDPPSGVSGHH